MLYYPLNSKTVLGITVTYPPNLANVHHSIMVYLLTLSSIVSNSTTLYLTFLLFVLRFVFILQELTNPSKIEININLDILTPCPKFPFSQQSTLIEEQRKSCIRSKLRIHTESLGRYYDDLMTELRHL